MRTPIEQKLANRMTLLAKNTGNSLITLEASMGMVGPEGLEPPTKRL